MLNKVILIGRLTKDIELRHTSNGTPTAKFTLAVNRNYKNDKGEYEADFIPIVVWNKLAEHCSKYIGKGSLVAVVGEIRTGSYEKNGVKHYTTDVYASEVVFLDSKKKDNANSDENLDVNFDDFVPVDDEDLPF